MERAAQCIWDTVYDEQYTLIDNELNITAVSVSRMRVFANIKCR